MYYTYEMPNSVEMLKKIVQLKPGGEVRVQQETAVSEIDQALKEKINLLLEAPTGSGKALRLDTPVLTVKGWSTMGELTTQDEVYGLDGYPTRVTAVHEPFMSKDMYSIRFSNGEIVYADSDHLWSVTPIRSAYESTLPEVDTARVNELSNKVVQLTTETNTFILSETEIGNYLPHQRSEHDRGFFGRF
jgi:hypothetical protein